MVLTFLSYHERHDGIIAIIKAIWQRRTFEKTDEILGYIIQTISSRQMEMWLNCDCASFSWNTYSFEQNKNDINCKGNNYISSIGKHIK